MDAVLLMLYSFVADRTKFRIHVTTSINTWTKENEIFTGKPKLKNQQEYQLKEAVKARLEISLIEQNTLI